MTEIAAAQALETFRRETGKLKDVSFPSISGAGPNGAIVHYRVTRKSNRRIAPGDLLIIATFAVYNEVELANYAPQLVYADANNRIARIGNGIPAQAA
mgnify:CR=1 FL=1